MTIKIKQCVFLAALSVVPLFASESFGGIGVSIYQSRDGVKIAEVIPGTPAAESRMCSGDVILAVDGESIKGLTIEESKAKLRGQKNKPLEITFVSHGDTISTTLRRTQITVKNLESERVESWFNNQSDFNAQELETFASATESDKQLVAVLKNGTLVKSDTSIAAKSLEGVYVERTDEFAPKAPKQDVNKPSSAKIVGLNRSAVMFELKTAGKAVVTIADADGTVFDKLVCENAKPGYNSLYWKSENVPSGRYVVTIEHNGSVNGKNVVLK